MTDSTLAATRFLLWSGFLYWLRWWRMMLVGVDSGVSLWMLVKRAPRLAKMPASRSRQTAQATPMGLLRLPRASVRLRDWGLVCWMIRCSKNHCFYEVAAKILVLRGAPRIIVFMVHRSCSEADLEKNRDRCAKFSAIQGTPVMGNLALCTM